MIRTLVRAGSVRPCEGPGAPQLRRSCPHRPARTGRLRIVVLLVATVAGWGCASTVGGEGEPPTSRGPTTTLESEIRALADGFGGAVGVYARRLDTGDSVSLAADELFPTASMIKVSLLVGLEEAVAAGQLTRDDRVAYHDSLHYPSGGDIINKLQPGAEIPLGHLAVLMIVLSDNTASLWIQGLIGGATVNTWLEEHGFERTRINSRVEGRRGDWESYGWGQSTPREMARLLVMIRDGKAVSQAASDPDVPTAEPQLLAGRGHRRPPGRGGRGLESRRGERGAVGGPAGRCVRGRLRTVRNDAGSGGCPLDRGQ